METKSEINFFQNHSKIIEKILKFFYWTKQKKKKFKFIYIKFPTDNIGDSVINKYGTYFATVINQKSVWC